MDLLVSFVFRGRRLQTKHRKTPNSPTTWAPEGRRPLPARRTWRRPFEAHTHTHTHTHGLCTLVAEHKWEWNWDELLAAEKRWTASLLWRRIFDRFNIYLYLFICVSIYWLCWWTDCLTLNSSGCKCNFTGHNELPGSAYVSRFFSASASKQKIFQNKSLWSCIYPMKPFVPKRWLWWFQLFFYLVSPSFYLFRG